MNLVKWLLIILGVLFVAFLAVVMGGYWWASSIQSIKLDAADVQVGGPYPPEERQALLDACQKNMKIPEGDKGACTCIADKAATDFSRFERLVLTAGFEQSPTKIVALTKGLMDSGLSESEVDKMQADSKARIDKLLSSCGLEKKQ